MVDELRPAVWSDYIGQERLKSELDVRVQSAIVDERPLDHVLLYGPAGAGKTSLATIIAERLGEEFMSVTMPIPPKALIRIITSFSGILLMDELHRASTREQETLLPLLEFGYVQDSSGRRIEANWLTVVGATTEKRDLITPLIDRFEIAPDFDEYTDEEMGKIVAGMASKAHLSMATETAQVLGKAAAGIPRRARKFVLAYRDLLNGLQSRGVERPPTHEEILDLCRTTTDGLTRLHLKYLETLHALGGTKGLTVLSSLLHEPPVILNDIERLLITKGLIVYGDKGRELTQAGVQRVKGPARKGRMDARV